MASSPFIFLLVEALLLFKGISAFANGPPRDVCENDLHPGADHGPTAMVGNGGYKLLIPPSLANVTSVGGFNYEAYTTYTGKIFGRPKIYISIHKYLIDPKFIVSSIF